MFKLSNIIFTMPRDANSKKIWGVLDSGTDVLIVFACHGWEACSGIVHRGSGRILPRENIKILDSVKAISYDLSIDFC